jgi:uncharacterized membrane protein YfcA
VQRARFTQALHAGPRRFIADLAGFLSCIYRYGTSLEVGGGMALVLVLSILIGVSLGLLGGGGSILTVPILTYVAGMSAKAAIASSLFVVGATSAVGAVTHARRGRVRWRIGVVFGLAGMAGAYAGGRLAAFVPGQVLMIGFAIMMVATATAMLRTPRAVCPARSADLPLGKVVLEGSIVGLVTGLVGAGGGFLVVPALVLLGGLRMEIAVGTSLVVIAMKSFAGLAGYLGHVDLDWPLTLAVTAAAIAGAVAGGRLAGRMPPTMLRRVFGGFIAVMAIVVLIGELA